MLQLLYVNLIHVNLSEFFIILTVDKNKDNPQ